MTDRSPTNVPNSRLMVRVENGSIHGLIKHVLEERGQNGRPRFIEIRDGDEALMLQLPADVVRGMYTPSEDGKKWKLSLTGEKILGMDARARQAFEERQPESREVLEERKERLRELIEDGPLPLAYALVQLCFNPKSGDPRYTGRPDCARVVKRNKEKVLEDAKGGKLPLDHQTSEPRVRVMDLVRYLAEALGLDLVCDFFWRHAYRQIVAEGWTPAAGRETQAGGVASKGAASSAASQRSSGKSEFKDSKHAHAEMSNRKAELSKPNTTTASRAKKAGHPSTQKRERKLEALRVSVKRMWKEYQEDCEGAEEGRPCAANLVESLTGPHKNLWPKGWPIPKDLKRWIADARIILRDLGL